MLVNVVTISLTEMGTFKLSKIDKDKKGERSQKIKNIFFSACFVISFYLPPFFDMCLKTSVRNFFLCLVLVRNNVEGLIEL